MKYTGLTDKGGYRIEIKQEESFKEKGTTENTMSLERLEGENGILEERFELFVDTGDPASINYACLSDISFIGKASVCSKVNTEACNIAICLAEKNKYSS